MIAAFAPSPTANGLLLIPPSIILLSLGKPEPTNVNTASVYFTNQRIVSLLLIRRPSHMSCHPTAIQAVTNLFAANGMRVLTRGAHFPIVDMSTFVTTVQKTLHHGIAITRQYSVLIPQLSS